MDDRVIRNRPEINVFVRHPEIFPVPHETGLGMLLMDMASLVQGKGCSCCREWDRELPLPYWNWQKKE